MAAGAIGGVGSGFVVLPWLLLVQHHTDDAVRGRVIAASEAFEQVAFLAGMGASVPVIAGLGAHRAYAIPGVLLALAASAALAGVRVDARRKSLGEMMPTTRPASTTTAR